MTTPVKFELAKLLKEKGFDIPVHYYHNEKHRSVQEGFSDDYWGDYTTFNWNAKIVGIVPFKGFYSAPTIAEVVMWLHEKHDIWIEVRKTNFFKEIRFQSYMNEKPLVGNLGGYISHSQPTKAYEAAIEYCLTNLI